MPDDTFGSDGALDALQHLNGEIEKYEFEGRKMLDHAEWLKLRRVELLDQMAYIRRVSARPFEETVVPDEG